MLLMSRRPDHRRRFALTLTLIAVVAMVLFLRFRRHYEDLIPAGSTSVLFLSPHVWAAYPAVLDRGVVHASRYPAIWTLPGAARLLHDPATRPDDRRRAAVILAETRRNLVDDILRYCPNPIFADVRQRKPYFSGPFDFIAFLSADPRFAGYRPGEKVGIYRLYRRTSPCAPVPPP
jgi:hypothetical protein